MWAWCSLRVIMISETAAEQGEKPTEMSSSARCTGRYCWEAQEPSNILRMQTTRPVYQVELTSLVLTEVMM